MVSRDAGRSFRAVGVLEGRYVRAVLFGPRHPRVVYLSAAEEGAPPLPLDLAKIWRAGREWNRSKCPVRVGPRSQRPPRRIA